MLLKVIADPCDFAFYFLKVVFSEVEIPLEELSMRPLELTQNPVCHRTSQNLLDASFLIGEGKATENMA